MDKLKTVPPIHLDIPQKDITDISWSEIEPSDTFRMLSKFAKECANLEAQFIIDACNRHGVSVTLENADEYKGRMSLEEYHCVEAFNTIKIVYLDDKELFSYVVIDNMNIDEDTFNVTHTYEYREI